MKKLLVLLVATFAVVGASRGHLFAQRLVTPLNADLQPLVSEFNARSEDPRLVIILSPT